MFGRIKAVIKNCMIVKMYRGFKRNIFKTNYNKTVLVSYVVYPIYMKENKTHCNMIEVNKIVECFSSAGFNVDIVDYDYKYKIDYKRYDVFFGLGRPMENAIKFGKKDCKKILYAVGQHPYSNNINAMKRLKNFYNYKGKIIASSMRLAEELWPLQLSLSDCIIVLGNKVTVQTFKRYYDGEVYALNAPTFDPVETNIVNKDIEKAKRNFLWFGSKGAIHKGLDLLLEVFKVRQDVTLHICGPVENEKEFFKLYYNEINNTRNIIFHGFVNIESNEFKKIVNDCMFTIFPSCAESASSSILNCMRQGLIPITTKDSGTDVDLYGYKIDALNINSINEIIDFVLKLDNNEIDMKSKFCYSYSKENYSISKYEKNLKNIIKKVILR